MAAQVSSEGEKGTTESPQSHRFRNLLSITLWVLFTGLASCNGCISRCLVLMVRGMPVRR